MSSPSSDGKLNDVTITTLLYIDKCNMQDCEQPGTKKCTGCTLAFYCCKDHQRLDWTNHKPNCLKWQVENVEGVGKCMIAKKVINTGSIILEETPLLVYPDMGSFGKDLSKLLVVAGACSYPCFGCGSGIVDVNAPHICSKCAIPLCSQSCENNILHKSQECSALQEIKLLNSSRQGHRILKDVFILRLLIQMKKSATAKKSIMEMVQDERIEKLISNPIEEIATINGGRNSLYLVESLFPLSCAYCSNAKLVMSLYWVMKMFSCTVNSSDREKGLYGNRIFVSHSCHPNAEMWVESIANYYKLFVRSKCMIQPGEKITVSVDNSLLFLPTLERRKILKSVHQIECECRRCTDPTECKLFVSGFRCSFSKCRGGYLVPKVPFDNLSVWKCHLQNCKNSMDHMEMRARLKKLEEELEQCSSSDYRCSSRYEKFIDSNREVLHPNHFLLQRAIFHLGKVASYFLGGGAKLVLCVISDFKHASKLCELKNDYILSLIKMHDKFKIGFKEDSGKLQYELACTTLALLLLKFKQNKQNRIENSSKEIVDALTKVNRLFNDAKAILGKYSISNNEEWIKEATEFVDVMSIYFKNVVHPKKDINIERLALVTVQRAIDIWIKVASDTHLFNEYVDPDTSVALGGKSLLQVLAEKGKS